MTPCKVIFMGTPELAQTILEKLIASKTYSPSLVITMPDKPVGRKHILTPPPVKLCAEEYAIPVLQPEKIRDQAFIDRIREENPDVIVVAAYGKIIPKAIIDIPTRGILNVHTSLLPKYRGASPVQATLLSGDAITGATIMLIDEGLDTGAIISQNSVAVDAEDTTETLMEKLAECGGDLLMETLPRWCSGELEPYEQNHTAATLTKILTKEDGEIKPEHSAEHIVRMMRAYTPWPGTSMHITDKTGTRTKLKIIRAHVTTCTERHAPMTLFLTPHKELCLATKDSCLILETVQPEGKNPMSGHAFYLGHQAKINR